MEAETTIDKAGRIVLPKPLRDELQLAPGDTLHLTVEGDKVTLRPQRMVSPLQKERGIWVLRTGEPLAQSVTAQALREIRDERGRRNAGNAR